MLIFNECLGVSMISVLCDCVWMERNQTRFVWPEKQEVEREREKRGVDIKSGGEVNKQVRKRGRERRGKERERETGREREREGDKERGDDGKRRQTQH